MDAPARLLWSIRRTRAEDAPSVFALQRQLNRPARSDSDISEYFVAISGPQLLGCAAVRKRGDVGYLYGLAVQKSCRGRGIGHALTQARLDWLLAEKAATAFVMAMFWNVRFFQKHGFSLTNREEKIRLRELHNDFKDAWSARSALLRLQLR